MISIFEGIDVYFHSFGAMLETVTGWIESGAHRPDLSVDAQLEIEIWRRHNPGIFDP